MGKANHSRWLSVTLCICFAAFVTLCLMWLQPVASLAADTVCAEVKIEVKQELTLERQAFDAHMRINNGLAHVSLEDVNVTVSFSDADGNTVLASSNAGNTAATFFIRIDDQVNIDISGGGGSVAPSSSADIHWLIIPNPGASNGLPGGTLYYVGATLNYTIGGDENVTEVTPDHIYVKPMPELALDYFIPHAVYGDDAFTAEVEEPVPFSLGVRVKNNGQGAAGQLKIDSGQPTIVDNDQGLLVGFVINSSEVNGRPAANSLQVDLGDILSGEAGIARWIMTCTLSGTFTAFNADFSHSDELGGELTSLIKQENINTHFLVRDVLVDLPGRDAVRDFLAKENPGSPIFRVFESDSSDTEVVDRSADAGLNLAGENGSESTYSLSILSPAAGFVVMRLSDPFNGTKIIKDAVRSDGKRIKAENVWLSKTRNPDQSWQHSFYLFDADSTGSYTLVFDSGASLPHAPQILPSADQDGIEQAPLAFSVSATDPDGTLPALSAAPLPAGAGFTDLGDGTGAFTWTPSAGQAGTYAVTFTASDGGLTDTLRVVITVNPSDDTDGDGLPDEWEMTHFGTLDRDGSGDFDGDGLSDLMEYQLGQDPGRENYGPSAPVVLTPGEGGEAALLSPELVIENSTDPDGDTLTYAFEVYQNDRLTDLVASGSGVAAGIDTTAWSVPVTLSDNAAYTWRVRAFDGVAYSLWAYGRFFVNTTNDWPAGVHISYPENGRQAGSPTPLLQVSAATDPDRDDLTYTFEVYADSEMTSLVTDGAGTAQNAMVSWTVALPLDDNADYFWRVVTQDTQGALIETELFVLHVNTANLAPTVPVISAPLGVVASRNLDLTVLNSTDPEEALVTYVFEIDTKATFDSPAKQASGPVAAGDPSTTWAVTDLADDTEYFWRARASDGLADSPWVFGSFFVNTDNDAPLQVQSENPGDLAWSDVLAPTLAVADAVDSDRDTLSYRFEVYGDPEMTDLVLDGENTIPAWTVSADLADNTRYFWRAQAVDPQGLSGEWMVPAALFIKQAAMPEFIEVGVSTDGGTFLSGVRVYAFTSAGAYTGLNALTDTNGIARFTPDDFSAGTYKFRADYLSRQFWSTVVDVPGAYGVDMVIAEETVAIAVTTAAGPAENVTVYVFSEAGAYLGLNGTTNAVGEVSFDLPSGASYTFRADIMGGQYWSGPSPVAEGAPNQFTVAAGGGRFTVTVQEDAAVPMAGTRVYLFTEGGSYLSHNSLADAAGQVAFDVPAGAYKVRADYLGYQFWSDVTVVVADTALDLAIPHQDVAVTVNSQFDGATEPLANIKVYLFTPQGSYLSRNITTDGFGQAVFHLPDQPYKVRADYLSQQFWSTEFTGQDTAVAIAMAAAEVSVGWGASYLEGVPVYAFTAAGAYLNLNQLTDNSGQVSFRLPAAGSYKFRADYQSSQYWTDETVLAADLVTPVEISTGGGQFNFTVLKNETDPLVGANCHVFSESGAYFGVYGPTSSEGSVSFDLAQGNYNIRVDYLGYQFWSPLFDVPITLAGSLTIPHQDVTITVDGVYDLSADSLENINVYLFTPQGAYLNQNLTTDVNGQVIFNLPDQPYKVRADYLDQQFWSDAFNQADTPVNIPLADADISVTGGGQPLAGVPVYVFSAAGAYLNLNQTTDGIGEVVFRLPAAGAYKFRADYQGSQYWTEETTLWADQVNPVELSTGGGPFVLNVLKGPDDPLTGAKCYVYTDTGAYLGMNDVTSSEGQVSFELADGTYKFRVDHLGYQFWSNVITLPGSSLETLTIPHQDVTLTVNSLFANASEPLSGIKVYLYKPSGVYLNLNQTTDAGGQVVFNLPAQPYKVRADYRNKQFWSGDFNQADTAVNVPMADARLTVTGAGQSLAGVKVYAFTAGGAYLNLNATTAADGTVMFRLPAGTYKFRADYQGSQFWADGAVLVADQVNPLEIATGGGAFALTVLKDAAQPLAGVPCYVFSESGAYLGMSGTTDADGNVAFTLADGNYQFRVNHLGYQFWTTVQTVPDTLAVDFLIQHQDITITVAGLYQTAEPISGVTVYLYTPSGAYQSQNQVTDEYGQVTFTLPDQAYKVRADTLGNPFWSDVFQSADTPVTVNRGLARVHAHRSGVAVAGATVYLYRDTGAYLSWTEATDENGNAEFLLPDRSFKFRVDEGGVQVYSDVITIVPGVENEVSVDLD